MVQKHSPLGRLNNIELALTTINSNLDMVTKTLVSRLEDLISTKFDELTTKITPTDTEVRHIEEKLEEMEEKQNDVEEMNNRLEEYIEIKFEELQINLERKIDEKFDRILAKIEEKDAKSDKIEKKLTTTLSTLRMLTSNVQKMESNLTNDMIYLQNSVDSVRKLCEWYSNWSSKHEVLLEHCYVARSEILDPLKKFLVDQENPSNIAELENKLKSFNIVKVDRATRFPNTGVYVNIKNDLINRFYIQELITSIVKRNNYEIRHNINALVAILSKVETFKKYDVHNFSSFEGTYELKWTVS